MTDVLTPEPAAAQPVPASSGAASGPGRRRFGTAWLGAVPFLAYTALFLLLPTLIVVIGAFFTSAGAFTLDNLRDLGQSNVVTGLVNSVVLSLVSALVGAVLGAILAYLVAAGPETGLLRRIVTAASGVLAQSGGVTLALAFIASAGSTGLVTLLLQHVGIDISGPWLYRVSGLVIVYAYFQIPLMVLVFLPALDGVRPQWREATESLGGSTWQYWRYVGGPILTPPFLGAFLLLFANAFAAFATAAALITQGGVILPLQIRVAQTSETSLGHENFGKALALLMVVIVALAMTAYTLIQRRASRWLR